MPRFLTFPDLEAVVRKKIADAGYRAYSSVPRTPVWPLCIVARVGGLSIDRRYMDAATVQVDVWGGAKGDATGVPKSTLQDMMQDIRVKVLELEGTKVTSPVGAWISGVEAGAIQWLPDQQTGRERYLILFTIFGRSLLPFE